MAIETVDLSIVLNMVMSHSFLYVNQRVSGTHWKFDWWFGTFFHILEHFPDIVSFPVINGDFHCYVKLAEGGLVNHGTSNT